MDNDLDYDYLSEDLPGFGDELPQSPVDAQDLMDNLDADYLENEVLIDEEGYIVRKFEREGETEEPNPPTDLEANVMNSEALSELVDAALAEEYPEAYADQEGARGQEDVPEETMTAMKRTMTGELLSGSFEALDPETLLPEGVTPETDDTPLDIEDLQDEQDLLLVEGALQTEADKPKAKKTKKAKTTKRTKTTKRSDTPVAKTTKKVARSPSAAANPLSVQHLQRTFDATHLMSAKEKLETLLELKDTPLNNLLGLAAQRCLTHLPECSSVTLTAWEEESEAPVPVWTLPKGLSLRRALGGSASPSANLNRPGLLVSDLSSLGLEHVALSCEGLWLSLLKLDPDPLHVEQSRGVLSLSGQIGLRSGAAFLDAVIGRLESPISLAV